MSAEKAESVEVTERGERRPGLFQRPWARGGLIAIGLLLLALGIAGLIRFQTYDKYQQSTDDAFVQTDAILISPKVSGYVDRVFVSNNQQVKAGQPLIRIDPRDYSAQASQSRAQIDLAQANAAGAYAQIAEQQAAVQQASAELEAAQAAARFAGDEVARYRPLAASGAETQERLATLRNEAAQTAAKAAAARAALVSARHRIATLESQTRQARAQIEAARAQFAAVSTNVEATTLRATADGRIGNKTVQQGQFIQAAARLMTLVPARSLFVEANFKETQLSLMRIGQPVHLEVDAYPDIELRGHIASFAPGTGAQFSVLPPQNATGNFTKIVQRVAVRIEIDASAETRALLVPGMSVDVSVDTRSGKESAARLRQAQERHNHRAGH